MPPTPHVLFIDDERFFAREYVRALEAIGLSITFADSADEALDHLKTPHNFQLIIVDVLMAPPAGVDWPASDVGIKLLQEKAQILASAHIPILILTNRAADSLTAEVAMLDKIGVHCEVLTKLNTSTRVLNDLVGRRLNLPPVSYLRQHA